MKNSSRMTLSNLELENERESLVQFDRFFSIMNQLATQPITAMAALGPSGNVYATMRLFEIINAK